MSEFIVLGLIPGTSLQISFAVWVVISVCFAAYIVMRANYRAKFFQAWVIATSIMVETQRRQAL
jgi:hypothetical protein